MRCQETACGGTHSACPGRDLMAAWSEEEAGAAGVQEFRSSGAQAGIEVVLQRSEATMVCLGTLTAPTLLSPVTDLHQSLVESASRGEPPGIDALLLRHLPALRTYVRARADSMLRAKESNTDLVQSVCREVLDHMDGFEYRGEAAFRKWLFQKAYTKILERVRFYHRAKRDMAREQPVPADAGESMYGFAETSPSAVAMNLEQMKLLEEAIDQLPDDQREVFVSSRIVGLPHAEIAEAMDKTPEAVRALLYRAVSRLGTALCAELGDFSPSPESRRKKDT